MFASARPPWRMSNRYVFYDCISAVRCQVRCSRHAGTVAAHCRFAPMFASARPPWRQPFDVFFDCISAVRCQVRCSRHAGTVAAHCRCAPMFASARPPWRCPFDVFSDSISTVKEIKLRPETSQRPTEGAFFLSESAEKNRTGWSAKA